MVPGGVCLAPPCDESPTVACARRPVMGAHACVHRERTIHAREVTIGYHHQNVLGEIDRLGASPFFQIINTADRIMRRVSSSAAAIGA